MSYNIRVEGADKISAKLEALADISMLIERDCADKIQETMRKTAVGKLTSFHAVDTGALRDSVETMDSGFVERESMDVVSIGIKTDVHYALPIEFGSGSKGEPDAPGKKSTADSWVYPTGNPQSPFRTAKAQPARPFMRPALYDNGKSFRQIIADRIRREMDGNRRHRAGGGHHQGCRGQCLHGMAPEGPQSALCGGGPRVPYCGAGGQ